VASSVVHILRVLEGLLRTAAVAPDIPEVRPDYVPPFDAALTELLEFAMLIKQAGQLDGSNREHIPATRCLLQLCAAAGPGSAEQRAMHGVLASVVKLCFAQHSGKVSGLLGNPGHCLVVAAEAAAYILKSSSCLTTAPAPATAPLPGADGTSSSSSQAAAVQLLPSLVIIGRMCVLYGAQLPPAITAMVGLHELMDPNVPQERFQ
jgi:hypothetical protein